jgi:hypothetical protein
MPELRLVVLALQDRLAYGPTFEAALTALFGNAAPSLGNAQPAGREAPATRETPGPRETAAAGQPSGGAGEPRDSSALIEQAARDLTDYQRLTAEGRLGEAGAKLESVKRALDELQKRRK